MDAATVEDVLTGMTEGADQESRHRPKKAC
jgi:hypothetical protein